jgi:hypothetical protein
MARPVYPYEMSDPDFSWLLDTFIQNNQGYKIVQETCLPLVLISSEPKLERVNYDSSSDFMPDSPYQSLSQLDSPGEEQV